MYKRIHSRAFDARMVCVGVSLTAELHVAVSQKLSSRTLASVYIFAVEATGRARPGHVMFHPRPSPFSMFPSPAQLNARTKSRNGEGLGPRLIISIVFQPSASCGGRKIYTVFHHTF